MNKKVGFSLAETLITIGIIGVVAAMTLPTLTSKYKEMVLKNQYKKVYSNFYNALRTTQVKLGYPLACFYWKNNPYGSAVCSKYSSEFPDQCIGMTLADGSPIPWATYNGYRDDCTVMENTLFSSVLKVAKYCENNALSKGCLTNNYHGQDKVQIEQGLNINPDASQFGDNLIKTKYPAWLLTDGTLIIRYNNGGFSPLYMIDINGHKGPNKWGYDIFTFLIRGDLSNGILTLEPSSENVVEKGGFTAEEMFEQIYK